MSAIVFVPEGWWHPYVKDGRVHEHPEDPDKPRNWSVPTHRLCERVYTKREP